MTKPPNIRHTEGARELLRRSKERDRFPTDHVRPKTRGDCVDGERPCPFVGCRYNLTLDVTPYGSIRWRQEQRWEGEPGALENCALDIADRGEHNLEQIGALTGVTRERVRQEIVAAIDKAKIHHAHIGAELNDVLGAPVFHLSDIVGERADITVRPPHALDEFLNDK